ncbi:MAG: hypothetical protein HOP02_12255 [Methylococcaceae bacterium]|nr:hypothetical protein [Methylococcaceae bacterium]
MSASGKGANAEAYAFVEIAQVLDGVNVERYGVGLDNNIVTAAVKALLSAVNRVQALAIQM